MHVPSYIGVILAITGIAFIILRVFIAEIMTFFQMIILDLLKLNKYKKAYFSLAKIIIVVVGFFLVLSGISIIFNR